MTAAKMTIDELWDEMPDYKTWRFYTSGNMPSRGLSISACVSL